MERDAIFAVVKELVVEKAGVDPGTVTLESTQSDIGIDSIHMVDLMMDLEERLGITLKDFDLARNPKLGDIVDLLEDNIGKGA